MTEPEVPVEEPEVVVPEKDPFSKAFDGLWAVLENSPLFCQAFKEGNRIKYNTTVRSPDKPEVNSADFPECRITPMRMSTKLLISSSSTFVDKAYQVQVALGDMRTNEYLHPLEFIVIAALANWQATLASLTWKAKPFIKLLLVGEAPEGKRQTDVNRGIASWSVMASITIQMYFHTPDLQNLALDEMLGEWKT